MQSIITFAGLAFANLAVAGPCKPLPQTTVSSVDVVSTTSAEPTVVTATLDPVSGVSTSAESSTVSESETGYESSTYVESSTLATVVIQETSSVETSATETTAETGTTSVEVETSATQTSAVDTTAVETTTEATSVETTAADTSAAETTAVETATVETSAAETIATQTTAADTTTADTTTADTTTADTTTADTTTADTTTVETTTEATSTEIETSATQTTTETAAPTADQSCDNGGMDYAIYTHQFYNSDPPRFTSFDATYFHDATPTYQGITERIGIQPNTDWTKPFKIYEDSPSQMYQYKAVNHRGFLYAPESGTYKVTVPNSDEITLVWFGDKAINSWTRGNADLEQDYPGGTSRSFNIDLEAGTYTPFRLLWANAQGELNFIAEVQAPGGKIIVNGDGADNKYLVRFSCDGTTPTWPDFY
ncbi:hypothetical protein FPOAC2_07478 [Fusarium poae]|jgi:hypothetical protein|uniref:PA14 domain-containing protein n=1 Tax=Fusarium poae TaxID=36050 RepID=A0A1B8AIA4_FUSPO|nr:hypothetical protein FPOAC1_010106 [Fusarium poae]KAG8670673.1 hypothetical protein FPOAC1_010106 [Fusarium poae]OBS20227.1 hypothetical protein FPOA_06613 [Fusarium poae]